MKHQLTPLKHAAYFYFIHWCFTTARVVLPFLSSSNVLRWLNNPENKTDVAAELKALKLAVSARLPPEPG
jgi:hypothetical protein